MKYISFFFLLTTKNTQTCLQQIVALQYMEGDF